MWSTNPENKGPLISRQFNLPDNPWSQLIASASDDCTVKVFDISQKNPIYTFTHKYQCTAVTWSTDASTLFTGGLDNTIRAFDIRNTEVPVYELTGHTDTITSLTPSPDGGSLLSNSMDNSLRMWDIKPFAVSGDRFVRRLVGAPHGFEKNLLRACWSFDGDFVAVGSGDRSVVVWYGDRIVYKLPGHKGCVNQVDWHPTEGVIVSCSSDRTLFLGEIDMDEVK